MPSCIFYKIFQCNCAILIVYVCTADAIPIVSQTELSNQDTGLRAVIEEATNESPRSWWVS